MDVMVLIDSFKGSMTSMEATPPTLTPVLRNTKQMSALFCLTLGRQRNTMTGTLTEASTYLLIKFLPLRIPSKIKAHRFMCIV
jgi:hypothetical protein